MYNVAMLLNDDATMLYNSWVTDYAMSRVHTAHMPRFSKTRLPELTKARSRVSRK